MKQISKTDELACVDEIKAFMMLAVVFCHASAIYTESGWFIIKPVNGSIVLGFLSDYCGLFHVQMFTFLAGYLFRYLKHEHSRYPDFMAFCLKKCKRLIIPYIFAASVWVVPIYLIFFNPFPSTVIRNFVLGESPSQLWYLLMLFWVYVFAYIIVSCIDKIKCSDNFCILLSALFCYSIALVLTRVGIPNLFQIITALKYLLFFFAGYEVRALKMNVLYRFPAILRLLTTFILSYIYIQIGGGMLSSIVWPFVCLLNCLLIWSVFISLGQFKGRILETLENYNFQIYLFHQQAIYVVLWFVNKEGYANPYLTTLLAFCISILISILFAKIIERIPILNKCIGLNTK